jgi:hypothetical protein
MTIPGLKTLDEMIAGLPVNSAQRLEITKLKEQIVALEQENNGLRDKLGKLTPKSDMAVDSVKILKLFFDSSRSLTPPQIAAKFEMKPNVAMYHMDTLIDKELIEPESIVIMNDAPRPYVITKEGRGYIISRGMD